MPLAWLRVRIGSLTCTDRFTVDSFTLDALIDIEDVGLCKP